MWNRFTCRMVIWNVKFHSEWKTPNMLARIKNPQLFSRRLLPFNKLWEKAVVVCQQQPQPLVLGGRWDCACPGFPSPCPHQLDYCWPSWNLISQPASLYGSAAPTWRAEVASSPAYPDQQWAPHCWMGVWPSGTATTFPGQMHSSPATERSRTTFSGLLFTQKGHGRRSPGALKWDTSVAGDVWGPPCAKLLQPPYSAWLCAWQTGCLHCQFEVPWFRKGLHCPLGSGPWSCPVQHIHVSVCVDSALPAWKWLGHLLRPYGAPKSLIKFQKWARAKNRLELARNIVEQQEKSARWDKVGVVSGLVHRELQRS